VVDSVIFERFDYEKEQLNKEDKGKATGMKPKRKTPEGVTAERGAFEARIQDGKYESRTVNVGNTSRKTRPEKKATHIQEVTKVDGKKRRRGRNERPMFIDSGKGRTIVGKIQGDNEKQLVLVQGRLTGGEKSWIPDGVGPPSLRRGGDRRICFGERRKRRNQFNSHGEPFRKKNKATEGKWESAQKKSLGNEKRTEQRTMIWGQTLKSGKTSIR